MSYPSTVIEPGSYPARFSFDGRVLPGTVDLDGQRPVTLQFYDEAGISKSGGYPQDHQIERLTGQMWTNHGIVLRRVQLSEIFPGQYNGVASYALVGLDIEELESEIRCVELQVEGLDEFFWSMPLKEYEWPRGSDGQFSVVLSDATEVVWTGEQLSISCSYPWKIEQMNGYGFRLLLAPVVTMESARPLSSDEWLTEWMRPFLNLISFGTGSFRRPTWALFSSGGVRKEESVSTQVYGLGITQEPYDAIRPLARDVEDRPLFTRDSLPGPLPDLIARWRNLERSDNPFVELYRLASVPELPARARFLYLVQALEGLHGFEHQDEDERCQIAHEAQRAALINEVEQSLGRGAARRVERMVDKRVRDSLDRRIKAILDTTPGLVVDRLAHAQDDPIAVRLAVDGDTTFQAIIRRLRNGLSHGSYNPDPRDLSAWIDRLDRLSRAQLLRLLGFSFDLIESRLG